MPTLNPDQWRRLSSRQLKWKAGGILCSTWNAHATVKMIFPGRGMFHVEHFSKTRSSDSWPSRFFMGILSVRMIRDTAISSTMEPGDFLMIILPPAFKKGSPREIHSFNLPTLRKRTQSNSFAKPARPWRFSARSLQTLILSNRHLPIAEARKLARLRWLSTSSQKIHGNARSCLNLRNYW